MKCPCVRSSSSTNRNEYRVNKSVLKHLNSTNFVLKFYYLYKKSIGIINYIRDFFSFFQIKVKYFKLVNIYSLIFNENQHTQ